MSNPTHRVRVLFISSDSSSTTGVGRSFVDLVTHLDLTRIEPHIVVPWPGADEANILVELRAAGIEPIVRHLEYWIPARRAWGARHLFHWVRTLKDRIWPLAALIERTGTDVVYTSTLPCIDGALAALITRRPHVWHVQEVIKGHPGFRSYLPWPLLRSLAWRLASRVLVPSLYLRDAIKNTANDTKVHIVHNGIDTGGFQHNARDKKAILSSLGLPSDCRMVVQVGTLEEVKSQEVLVRAVARLNADFADTMFVFVGTENPEYADRLKSLIHELGFHGRFRFLGPRSDVASILAASECLVLTSRFETFGRVLVEAMATGLPVVATRCGGPEEIVQDGITGYLIDIGDDLALAHCIDTLLANPDAAKQMGAAGRLRAAKDFSISEYARNIQDILVNVHTLHQESSA